MLFRIRRLWDAITEPRHLKVAYFVVYVVTTGTGVATWLMPPQSIEGPLGAQLTAIWSGLFILGGLVGAVTVLPGWWWAERLLGIAPVLLGLAIYLSVVAVLHWQGMSSGASRLTQLGIIVIASAPFALRGLLIREYSYEPRRG
ncbi:hypothetical protein [Microbacterium halotolerans]|uniref:hypothetical protein n=1 Tax=Microbacterium halotolerans TaxID=246613 RepID=UPI0013C2CA3D|nr:hypothetical protein [Microbacterium halotolerans]